jgi:PPE-repeat protein
MALPPDVNAARILGPGPGSAIAAGTASQGVGAALDAAVANVTAAVATLTSLGWTGPSGVSTAASFGPHLAVMATNATNFHLSGVKHLEFAEAYQAAYLAIPPLAHVVENQAEHMTLQATNFMGINAMPIAVNRGI